MAAVGLTGLLYQFTHISLEHFTVNILALFVLGMRVERYLGGFRFLVFYLVSGLAAAFGCWALTLDGYTPLVGASGAVSAVTGGYLAHVIHVRGTSRFETVVGVLFGLLAFSSFALEVAVMSGYFGAQEIMPGVAHAAHVAGWVFGYLVILALSIVQKRRNRIRITAAAQ